MKSGAVASKYGQAIFRWYFGNELLGAIVAHVNFCFDEAEILQSRVLNSLHQLFVVKFEICSRGSRQKLEKGNIHNGNW